MGFYEKIDVSVYLPGLLSRVSDLLSSMMELRSALMIFRVLRWLNILTVSLLGWISTSIKSIFCPPCSWTKLSLLESFFVNLTCPWLNALLDASWVEYDAFKLLPFKLGKLGLLCLISIRYFHV